MCLWGGMLLRLNNEPSEYIVVITELYSDSLCTGYSAKEILFKRLNALWVSLCLLQKYCSCSPSFRTCAVIKGEFNQKFKEAVSLV